MPRAAELVGRRYGRLVALELHGAVNGRRRWLCRCDCGETTTVTTNMLNMGKVKSCGCLVVDARVENGKRLAEFNSKPRGTAAFNHLKNSYIQGARARNLLFDLTDEEFRNLTSGFCFYCGAPPSRCVKPTHNATSGDYQCNGVDRMDSSLGYTFENCVTCCSACNYAKREMGVEQFELWARRVAEFTLAKRLSEEELLAIVIRSIESEQSGDFACRENAIALTKIQEAMHWLNHRTRDRISRGVEGTEQK